MHKLVIKCVVNPKIYKGKPSQYVYLFWYTINKGSRGTDTERRRSHQDSLASDFLGAVDPQEWGNREQIAVP